MAYVALHLVAGLVDSIGTKVSGRVKATVYLLKNENSAQKTFYSFCRKVENKYFRTYTILCV